MSIAINFGQILRSLRKEKGLSQDKLSELTNIDRSYISLLERGQRQPTLMTLFNLCKHLDIKPSQLVKILEEQYENRDRKDT